MDKNYLSFFFKTILFTGVLLVINILFFQFILIPDQEFYYPLPVTYIFFCVFSLIIIGILIKISTKNKEQLGYAFLLLTSIKMALSYVFARPIIAQAGGNPTEKVNFFVIFILFLAIEAYYTARLLNNKQ
ncbi:DUF6168 family protein [Flavobacterium sp. DG1-102-2]|uniref:DUF6168 family protein n=1 Tax=Flavobacterium sp. DG1-102-2 TaxID=3081663 RepID=UPI002948FB35|nr:DUF6168 family protein [Flavobacterium sp. DG1-102-2]MDV6167707.1 DUF6168 family protein [Flavobacterium sp. DG1-102-2]